MNDLVAELDTKTLSLISKVDSSIHDVATQLAQGGHRALIDIVLNQFQQEMLYCNQHGDTWGNNCFIDSIFEEQVLLLKNIDFSKIETEISHPLSPNDRTKFVSHLMVCSMENGELPLPSVPQKLYDFICENLKNGVFYRSWADVNHAINQMDYVANQSQYGTVIADIFFKARTSPCYDLEGLLKAIARGFALGGHESNVYEFITIINKGNAPGNRDFFSHELVKCFAQNGYIRQAYQLLSKIEQNNWGDVLPALGSMAHGVALLGHQGIIDDYLNKVCSKYSFSNLSYNLLKNMAYGFAENGNITAVDSILEQMTAACPDGLRWELGLIGNIYASIGLKVESYKMLIKIKQRFLHHTSNTLSSAMQYTAEWIVLGFIMGGYTADAYEFIQYIIRENLIWSVYSVLNFVASHTDSKGMYHLLGEVEKRYPEHIGDMLCIIYLQEMEKVKQFQLDKNMQKVKMDKTELNKKVVLQALSMAGNSDLHPKIISNLTSHKACKTYCPYDLIPIAIKFHTIMKTQKINYNQVVFGWIQPDVSTCLLQCIALKLPVECILMIVTYLTPLTLAEVRELADIFPKHFKSSAKLKTPEAGVTTINESLKLFSGTAHFWSNNSQYEIRSNSVPYARLL